LISYQKLFKIQLEENKGRNSSIIESQVIEKKLLSIILLPQSDWIIQLSEIYPERIYENSNQT